MHAIPYLMLLKFDYKVVTLISNTFQRNIANGSEITTLSSFLNVFDPHVAEIMCISNQKEKKMLQNALPLKHQCMFNPIPWNVF